MAGAKTEVLFPALVSGEVERIALVETWSARPRFRREDTELESLAAKA